MILPDNGKQALVNHVAHSAQKYRGRKVTDNYRQDSNHAAQSAQSRLGDSGKQVEDKRTVKSLVGDKWTTIGRQSATIGRPCRQVRDK